MKNSATFAIIFLYGTDFINCHSTGINNNLDQEMIVKSKISDVNNSSYEEFIFIGKYNHHLFVLSLKKLFVDSPRLIFETAARQQDEEQQGHGNKKKKDLLTRILPLFVIPYLVQSAFLPMILISLKAMLLQTLFLGKIALILGVFNALRSQAKNTVQDKFSDTENGKNGRGGMSDDNVMKNYYGYNGNEEFGAWIHH